MAAMEVRKDQAGVRSCRPRNLCERWHTDDDEQWRRRIVSDRWRRRWRTGIDRRNFRCYARL